MGVAGTIELDGQYRLLREEAGLVDRSGRGKLLVAGTEGAEFLQGQLTNDIEALEPSRGCYSALLDRKGHMQADMRVLRLEREQGLQIWLDTEAEVTAAVRGHLDRYRIGRDVDVEEVTQDWAILSLIGPAAAVLSGAPPVSPEHAQAHFTRDGVEALAVATDLGLDLICRASGAAALTAGLAAAGIAQVSLEAAEITRVESGRPRFGREMTGETIPQEAGINERAISFTKGCYIGQETVARLHYKGKPNRHLRGLRLDGQASAGDPVSSDQRELGAIGTAVLSPALGPIALAILRREAQVGDAVRVGEGSTARVVELPFAG